jgi:hypothetical protein
VPRNTPQLVLPGEQRRRPEALVDAREVTNLIDGYLLMINPPLVLGSGRKLFPNDDMTVPLELVSAIPTTTGVVAIYRPAPPREKR